jgi:SAM-dependent methyltransferase
MMRILYPLRDALCQIYLNEIHILITSREVLEMSEKEGHVFSLLLFSTLNNSLRRWLSPPSRILDRLSVKSSDTVIDFGCGTGFYTIPLAKTAKRVVGIDVQAKMLKMAGRYAEKSNVKVQFYESDGKNIPLPDSTADLIFLRRVFHELEDKQAVLQELTRLLKQNGRLAIMEKTKKSLTPIGPPTVEISDIANCLRSVGLQVTEKIEIANETIIIGKRLPYKDLNEYLITQHTSANRLSTSLQVRKPH